MWELVCTEKLTRTEAYRRAYQPKAGAKSRMPNRAYAVWQKIMAKVGSIQEVMRAMEVDEQSVARVAADGQNATRLVFREVWEEQTDPETGEVKRVKTVKAAERPDHGIRLAANKQVMDIFGLEAPKKLDVEERLSVDVVGEETKKIRELLGINGIDADTEVDTDPTVAEATEGGTGENPS